MLKNSTQFCSSRLRPLTRIRACLFLILLVTVGGACADDFFEVRKVTVHKKAPRDERGVWNVNPKDKTDKAFIPCVEAAVWVAKPARSKDTFARAYFFGRDGKCFADPSTPSVAVHGKDSYAVPTIYSGDDTIFFEIPESLSASSDWRAVIVFGDKEGVAARGWPEASVFRFEFPEKDRLNRTRTVKRKAAVDPVIECVVSTTNPKHPKITLFLRLPNGVADGSQVHGVLAMCVLGNSSGEVRRKLQAEDPGAEMGVLARYADAHKLAILCWGAQTLWLPGASYDELERRTNRELDEAFDAVANAWERGVVELHAKYAIPRENFLLWGICGAAQWAHRLALRKPDYFLAAYVHMPSSFDRPTPEGANLLWLLTVGELDGGYERATRFFADCRSMGYPMIFKGIAGLGHAGSPIADQLGLALFDYALALKTQKIAWKAKWADRLNLPGGDLPEDWRGGFYHPEFFGDYLNQTMVPTQKKTLIPEVFRVPLPTRKLAEAWKQ